MKKNIIAIILIAAAIALIIFGFKSCNARTKTQDQLNGEYYSAFINANISFTCEVIKNPEILKSNEESKKLAKEKYLQFGLPVENNEQMIEIMKQYENDQEVISIIKTNTEACKSGGIAISYP